MLSSGRTPFLDLLPGGGQDKINDSSNQVRPTREPTSQSTNYLCCLRTHKPVLWFCFASKLMCRYTLHPLLPPGIFVLCDSLFLLSRPSPAPGIPSLCLGLLAEYSRIFWLILVIIRRGNAWYYDWSPNWWLYLNNIDSTAVLRSCCNFRLCFHLGEKLIGDEW